MKEYTKIVCWVCNGPPNRSIKLYQEGQFGGKKLIRRDYVCDKHWSEGYRNIPAGTTASSSLHVKILPKEVMDEVAKSQAEQERVIQELEKQGITVNKVAETKP